MIPRASALFLAAVLFACTGGGGAIGEPGTGTPTPVPEGEVVGVGGLEVKAAFAAATLGDPGCGGASGASSESGFAPSSDSAARCAEPLDAGPAERGGCGGGCRPSTLQISFTTGATGTSAKVQISAVTLNDLSTGAEVAKLTPSNPQIWDKPTSTYKSWDGTLAASVNAQASYTLSTPALERSFDKKYRMQVTLVIDGQTIILQSDVLSREPDVAT